MTYNDLRLIEDYLPIEAISAEASREKSVRKGHISTLHLWWARRPLVACRAAVYGALVPADRWVKDIDMKNPPADPAKAEATKNGKKRGLNRKAAKEFVTKLCRYPKTDPKAEKDIKVKRETEQAIVEAQRHILEAHADRLTAELAEAKKTGLSACGDAQAGKPPAWVEEFKFQGDTVTYDDIVAGRAPRPRVLDMFAGGGAIPLEALRLGCEAYALDLNPVAHIIELCTLVYPQKYGKPDTNARGMTGSKNAKGETTWGGLVAEVRYWGNWVLDRVRKEIGDLYPPIPDPEVWDTPPEIAFDRQTGQWNVTKPGKPKRGVKLDTLKPNFGKQMTMNEETGDEDGEDGPAAATIQLSPGFLQPVAYLWTRAVRCKKPGCPIHVPLIKQGWLVSKKDRVVAVRPLLDNRSNAVLFEVVSADSKDDLDFDPSNLGSGKGTECPKCATPVDLPYIKAEGTAKRFVHLPVAVVALRGGIKGKMYLSASSTTIPTEECIRDRLIDVERRMGVSSPDEVLEANPRSFDVQNFGFSHWRDLFTSRELLGMTCFTGYVRSVSKNAVDSDVPTEYAKAVSLVLTMALGRLADYQTAFCTWQPEFIKNTFNAPGLPMIYDFAESNPLAGSSGSWASAITYVGAAVEQFAAVKLAAAVSRGSAMSSPYADSQFDAVVTDPPYYDSRSYSNLADHFYVWHKRGAGHLFPEHFSSNLTPKKNEAIAAPYRHEGSKAAADAAYEDFMRQAFSDVCRVLKPGRPMVCVYAHKTTAGWATLINSLMKAGFMVVEAWPVAMERRSRQNALETGALASSILLVARKREEAGTVGSYEGDVQPALLRIVRERMETLWDMSIAGADLVIACVGAGLRAFTKYGKVEYANGEEVPAKEFLAEVEGVVLDIMLAKLSGAAGGNVSAVDNPSRFYVLWRFVYKTVELDAGEAIVFSNGTHIELDGPQGLSAGGHALVEKKKAKYRARDFTERGEHANLGLPHEDGQPAPLIDVLHRILWLMENSPRKLNEFLDEARPDRERLRVLAQALAGAALSGKSEEEAAKLVSTTPAEQTALGKLLANWRSLVESRLAAGEEGLFGNRGK